MASPKAGEKILGAQVPEHVYHYLKAFAAAKNSSVSREAGAILRSWYDRRYAVAAIDEHAHRIAEEGLGYGPDPHQNKPTP